jgi:hypothetical protein
VTPQEEQLLTSLVERVNSTQLQEKDPDAEGLLNRGFNSNPDALYILAQAVLVQNIALEQAKAQVMQLQEQLQQARQQPAHATSFLGSLLGRHDPQPAPPAQPAQSQFQPAQQPQFQPVQQPQYIPAQQPQYMPAAPGQPSFLQGAMQTAAGVAAGALAFEGVEAALHGIMGHPGFGGGYGWGGSGFGPAMGMGGLGMGGGFERPVEETVVNNYYDQPGGGPEHHEQAGQTGFDAGSGDQHFHESSDRRGDQGGAQFTDAGYNTQGDGGNGNDSSFEDSGRDSGQDLSQNDNAGFDNGGQDDSGGFDDGGGFDSGGGNDLA